MANYTISLTDEQRDAFIEMLNSDVDNITSDLSSYLLNIADAHLEAKLEEEFKTKTVEEKKTLLS